MKRAAALALGLFIALLPVLPATAQSNTGRGKLELIAQTPWVGRGEDFNLRVSVPGAKRDDDTEVAVSVYQPVASRSAFTRTLEDKVLGSPLLVTAGTLAELAPNNGQQVPVRLPVQDPAQPRDRGRLLLRGAGVYPVRVELRGTGGGRVIDRLTTHLIYQPEAVNGPKLSVALVVPVHAPPALQPDGRRELSEAAAARLGAMVATVDRHPEVPVVLDVTPETLEALAVSGRPADAATVATLGRIAARTGQLLANTYVRVPLAAYDGALASEAAAQLGRGLDTINQLVKVRPDARYRLARGPLDPAAVAALRDQQADRIVLPEAALESIPLRVTLTQPFQLDVRQARQPAAVAIDAGLTEHFRTGAAPVLVAHQLLADLAVVYFDSPALRRGVVAVPADGWRPDAGFLDAVLAGLDASPVLQPATLAQLFDGVPSATAGRRSPLVRRVKQTRDGRGLDSRVVRRERARIDAFSDILDPGAPVLDRLDETLLTAQSLDLSARQHRRYLEGVAGQVGAELRKIVIPARRSVTLTARRGKIPVTVVSEAGYPVHLVLRIASDRLEFPDGSERRLDLLRRNTTQRFTVEARTSGAFPLIVTLESPNRRLVLHSSRFTVRSTATSGVGIILSAGAGLVLLGWWARQIGRGRRSDRRHEGDLPASTTARRAQ